MWPPIPNGRQPQSSRQHFNCSDIPRLLPGTLQRNMFPELFLHRTRSGDDSCTYLTLVPTSHYPLCLACYFPVDIPPTECRSLVGTMFLLLGGTSACFGAVPCEIHTEQNVTNPVSSTFSAAAAAALIGQPGLAAAANPLAANPFLATPFGMLGTAPRFR